MSRKYLIFILILFFSLNIVAAQDNLTDDIGTADESNGLMDNINQNEDSVQDNSDLLTQSENDVQSANRPEDGWSISINPVKEYYTGKDCIYPVHIFNSNGNYDSNGKSITEGMIINLYLDGKYEDSETTDSNGNAYFKLGLGPGKYSVNVKLDSLHDYNCNSPSSNIEILQKTKVTTTDLKVNYKQSKLFKIKIRDGFNEDLENIPILVKVGGRTLKLKTDYNGMASFNTKSLKVGSYNVKILSNSKYYIVDGHAKIKVNKVKTKVVAPKITAYYKKSKKFKIRLYDKKTGKAAKQVKISVKAGNKKYNLKTNSKGVASFNTKNLKVGKHKVKIKSRNSNYVINAKSIIKIKKIVKKSAKSRSKSSSSGSGQYVGNTNTYKFHYPSCSAVKRMKSSNKIYLTHSQAISWGYSSCGICHP